jgi:protein kinase C substrate 80K-H
MKTQKNQHLFFRLFLCFSLLIFFIGASSSVHCSREGEERNQHSSSSTANEKKKKNKREAFLGVDPLHAHEYDRTKLNAFSCDEKIEIDFARVNDNFCDCPTDGSDEPGTNACSGITPQQKQRGFYCQNHGSKPKLIKSSFVNDNVCDCCDGSDEKFNAKKHCENTCANDGREAMESLREEVRNFEIGVGKKQNEYAKKAKNAKKEAEKEVVRLRKAVEQLREEKEKKEAEEEKAKEVFREHEKLKEERDREKEEEERKRREKEEEEEKNRDHHHHHPDDESKEEREMREMEEEMREIEREEAAEKTSGDDNDERESEEAKKDAVEEREETDEERGRRIAEQWVHGDDNDRSEGEEKEGEEEEEEDFIDGDYDGHHDPYDEEDDYGGEDGYYPPYDDDSDQGEEQEATKEEEEKVGMFGRMKRMVMGGDKKKAKHEDNKLEEEERALEDARKIKNEASRKASEAREKFEESNTKLSTFNAKIEKLSSTTDDETTKLLVGALSDQCFSTKADKYTYEICLFGQSKQDNHVRLGDMKSEITFDDLTGKRFAKFENGEKCWNGPKRSMTVELVCGSKESLFDVQEPSRCEYSSKFTTPIACDEKQLEMKKIELNKLAEREKNNYSSKEGEEVEYVVNY